MAQNMKNQIYKIYQLLSFFINKFSYQSFYIKEIKKDNEIWLTNKSNSAYQLIRITNSSLEDDVFDKERIESYLNFYKQHQKLSSLKFVDIHISNEKVYSNESYDTVCINTDYYDGIDLSSAFPSIHNVIHEVKNEQKEINDIVNEINNVNKTKNKSNLKAKVEIFFPNIVILITVALCVCSYILNFLLSLNYSDSSALIFLGADYKMFTLGLNQFWRLFTYAFSHGSILHLILNMMALFNIGRYIEYKYGHLKTALLLFFGIVVAGLTNGILTGDNNTLCIGMSGGIYTLFSLYLLRYIKEGGGINGPILVTLGINLYLNFLPNVSWQAHLGGAIVGVLFFFYEENGLKHFIILTSILALALGVKYYSKEKITPIYGGTDAEVISIYENLGFKSIASNTENKLYKIYVNDGKLK